MTKLLSGEEALIALANGEGVEFKCGGMSWTTLDAKQQPLEILIDEKVRFRLKPRTITLNGIEVPAPFKPKEGEIYWFITDCECGYNWVENKEGCRVGIAAWRTESDIKQVIVALRTIFKTY